MTIKEARINNNMTQRELAIKINVAESTINLYENYKREPLVLIAIKIANALKVDVEDIFKKEYYL